MSELTAERLRELLHYDPETGVFVWRMSNSNRVPVGSVAGSWVLKGYRHIQVDGKAYKGHRLAWLHVNGVWPKDQIDHIDGDRGNNAIRNLRQASQEENAQNRRLNRNSSVGLMGVTYHQTRGTWQAQIQAAGLHRNLGYFDTPEAAHAAYLAAKKGLHAFNPVPRTTTTGTAANDDFQTIAQRKS